MHARVDPNISHVCVHHFSFTERDSQTLEFVYLIEYSIELKDNRVKSFCLKFQHFKRRTSRAFDRMSLQEDSIFSREISIRQEASIRGRALFNDARILSNTLFDVGGDIPLCFSETAIGKSRSRTFLVQACLFPTINLP